MRGKLGHDAEGGFLGGTHSVRPQVRAGRKPGHSISTGRVHDEPRAYRPHASVKPMPPSRACGPRPSAGGPSKLASPSGGRPGNGAKDGFLGGTHSVRPRCKAGGKPRHNIIIGGKRAPGGPMGRSPGGGEASFAGVLSPPLRQMAKRCQEGLAEKTRR